jgi:diguanylate cyclase (GGDEF)-like protein/PAS domain S-box-containing protein
MTILKQIKLLLAAAIVLFAAAAVYISALVVERQAALDQVSRYNVAWLVSQATTEFARLEQRISAHALPGSGISADEVQLRFDIILNRLKLLASGDVEEFLQTDPEHQATVNDFAEVVHLAQPLIEDIDRPGNVQKLLKLLTPLDGKLARLAAAANRFGGDRVADDQRQLVSMHWQFSALAGGLLLSGILLIGLLFRHNKLLQRAHTDLNAATTEITAQNERFDAALNNMSQGLCMVDHDQRLIICNTRYQELFGLNDAAVAPGRPIRELLDYSLRPGAGDAALTEVLGEQHGPIIERVAKTYFQELSDSRTFAVSHQPMAGGGWVATYEDISERRRAEARIAHMAHHDALTDLPNRLMLHERMEQAAEGVSGDSGSFAILCLDLDRFKNVNDTLGHPTGDALLKAVAVRLRKCAGESEIVARLGGDEFAILQGGAPQPSSADALARSILEVLGAPYDLDGQHVVISASIGVAVAPAHGLTPDQLLKNADMALYRAKADGRSLHRFFEPEMDADLQRRRLLELDLRKALAAGEFELHYQPLVDLKTGEIRGCEALLRWRNPERGLVSPGEFIPIAEEVGLIVPIGEWVLREACKHAVAWPKPISVAVNLSALQLKSRHLLETVLLALATSGLPASRLELEITESAFMDDNELTMSILHDLRSIGVRIAMDDFGTGYSSLSYLRSFPFDKIKLDQSFVRDLSQRPDCVAIVQSIAMLGQNLGMVTTAEGIETLEQKTTICDAGFVEGQGYYFHRPMTIDRLTQVLADDRQAVRAA